MIRPARAFRRWVLGALPLVLLLGWGGGEISAWLGLAAWMALGRALPRLSPFPRGARRALLPHRLLLSLGVFALSLRLLMGAAQALFPDAPLHPLLSLLGALGPALIVCQLTVTLPLPRPIAGAAGAALLAMACAFLLLL